MISIPIFGKKKAKAAVQEQLDAVEAQRRLLEEMQRKLEGKQ